MSFSRVRPLLVLLLSWGGHSWPTSSQDHTAFSSIRAELFGHERCQLPRVRASDLHEETFEDLYVRTGTPVIIEGVFANRHVEDVVRPLWSDTYFQSIGRGFEVAVKGTGGKHDHYYNGPMHPIEPPMQFMPLSQAIPFMKSEERESNFYIQSTIIPDLSKIMPRPFFDSTLDAESAQDQTDQCTTDAAGKRWCARIWLGLSDGRQESHVHFDANHNLHTVIDGGKYFTLYPPEQTKFMYQSPGAAFSPIDVHKPNFQIHPLFRKARALRCALYSGETLFLPALWWHNVLSLAGRSLGINWWYHMKDEYFQRFSRFDNFNQPTDHSLYHFLGPYYRANRSSVCDLQQSIVSQDIPSLQRYLSLLTPSAASEEDKVCLASSATRDDHSYIGLNDPLVMPEYGDTQRPYANRVTALTAAVVQGWVQGVECLLGAGADPNAHNGDGLTALHYAASWPLYCSDWECMQLHNSTAGMIALLLLDHGADVSLQETTGWRTAVHFAAATLVIDGLQHLVSAMPDSTCGLAKEPSIRDVHNRTAWDLGSNHHAVAAVLQTRCAKVPPHKHESRRSPKPAKDNKRKKGGWVWLPPSRKTVQLRQSTELQSSVETWPSDHFKTHYFATLRPVLMKFSTFKTSASKKWAKPSLLRTNAQLRTYTGPVRQPVRRAAAGEVKLLSLSTFLSTEMGKEGSSEMAPYTFTAQLDASHSLFKDVTLPDTLLPCGSEDPAASYIHVGANRAGLSWHLDDHTIYYSTFGRIHWLLMPAASPFLLDVAKLGVNHDWKDWPPHDWLQKIRPLLSDKANASITEIIQEPNEFFYVPASWARAAIFQTDVLLFARTFCRPNEFGLIGASFGAAN